MNVLEFELRDLDSNLTYFQTEAAFWGITRKLTSTNTSQCSGTWLLGGYRVANYSEIYSRRYLSLPLHNVIYFSIEVWLLGLTSGADLFVLNIDGHNIDTWSIKTLSLTQNCSESGVSSQILTAQGVVAHNSQNLSLLIKSSSNSSKPFSLGFRNLNILFSSQIRSTSTGSTQTYFCPMGQYKNGTTCKLCNPLCKNCIGSTVANCTSCINGASFNGQECFHCDPSCQQCNGINSTNCIRCPSGSFLYQNGTCRPSCLTPFTVKSEGEFQSCLFPCNTTQFLYEDGTCQLNCLYPFIIKTEGEFQSCVFPCNTIQFLYEDGTCKSICDTPFLQQNSTNGNYCNFRCGSQDFLNWNGICESTCEPPNLTEVIGTAKYCSKNTYG